MNIHTLFILLIAMAMACDIFGIVVQRGANLVRIDVRTAQAGRRDDPRHLYADSQ